MSSRGLAARLHDALTHPLTCSTAARAVSQARLRSQFVLDLQRANQGVLSKPAGDDTLKRRAVNSLVAEYLRLGRYDCTLSVFLPESKVAHTLFARDDVLQVRVSPCVLPPNCGCNPLLKAGENGVLTRTSGFGCAAGVYHAPGPAMPNRHAQGTHTMLQPLCFPSHLTMTHAMLAASQSAGQQERTPLLEVLLDQLVVHNKVSSTAVSCGVQTDTEAGASDVLSAKLQAVQDRYLAQAQADRAAPNHLLEDRLARYQRECDARARREIENEVRGASLPPE